jgi:hypothetical protein
MNVIVTGEEFLRGINQVNNEIVKSLNAEFAKDCAKRAKEVARKSHCIRLTISEK